jgi:DNA-binding NarL/FixJ family response regulator
MTDKISVVVADEERLFREAIHIILDQDADIEVVGEAANRLQTIETTRDHEPDVILIDISSSKNEGVAVLSEIIRQSPKTKPIALIRVNDEAKIFRTLREGAKGYLSKNAPLSDLIKAVKAVHNGELWVQRKLMASFLDGERAIAFKKKAPADEKDDELTDREQEVLNCLIKGCTNKEIAKALFISEKTVKNHLSSIFKKLNVNGRLQAVRHALFVELE